MELVPGLMSLSHVELLSHKGIQRSRRYCGKFLVSLTDRKTEASVTFFSAFIHYIFWTGLN